MDEFDPVQHPFCNQIAQIDTSIRDCQVIRKRHDHNDRARNNDGASVRSEVTVVDEDPFNDFRTTTLDPARLPRITVASGTYVQVPSRFASVGNLVSIYSTQNKSDISGDTHPGLSTDTRFGITGRAAAAAGFGPLEQHIHKQNEKHRAKQYKVKQYNDQKLGMRVSGENHGTQSSGSGSSGAHRRGRRRYRSENFGDQQQQENIPTRSERRNGSDPPNQNVLINPAASIDFYEAALRAQRFAAERATAQNLHLQALQAQVFSPQLNTGSFLHPQQLQGHALASQSPQQSHATSSRSGSGIRYEQAKSVHPVQRTFAEHAFLREQDAVREHSTQRAFAENLYHPENSAEGFLSEDSYLQERDTQRSFASFAERVFPQGVYLQDSDAQRSFAQNNYVLQVNDDHRALSRGSLRREENSEGMYNMNNYLQVNNSQRRLSRGSHQSSNESQAVFDSGYLGGPSRSISPGSHRNEGIAQGGIAEGSYLQGQEALNLLSQGNHLSQDDGGSGFGEGNYLQANNDRSYPRCAGPLTSHTLTQRERDILAARMVRTDAPSSYTLTVPLNSNPLTQEELDILTAHMGHEDAPPRYTLPGPLNSHPVPAGTEQSILDAQRAHHDGRRFAPRGPLTSHPVHVRSENTFIDFHGANDHDRFGVSRTSHRVTHREQSANLAHESDSDSVRGGHPGPLTSHPFSARDIPAIIRAQMARNSHEHQDAQLPQADVESARYFDELNNESRNAGSSVLTGDMINGQPILRLEPPSQIGDLLRATAEARRMQDNGQPDQFDQEWVDLVSGRRSEWRSAQSGSAVPTTTSGPSYFSSLIAGGRRPSQPQAASTRAGTPAAGGQAEEGRNSAPPTTRPRLLSPIQFESPNNVQGMIFGVRPGNVFHQPSRDPSPAAGRRLYE